MDQIGFGPDGMYLMTYFLTYLFARCTRSVKVPAPVYYADLAAYRARLMLDGEDAEAIDDSETVASTGGTS